MVLPRLHSHGKYSNPCVGRKKVKNKIEKREKKESRLAFNLEAKIVRFQLEIVSSICIILHTYVCIYLQYISYWFVVIHRNSQRNEFAEVNGGRNYNVNRVEGKLTIFDSLRSHSTFYVTRAELDERRNYNTDRVSLWFMESWKKLVTKWIYITRGRELNRRNWSNIDRVSRGRGRKS